MIPTPNLSCPIDTIRGTGAREFSGLGIRPIVTLLEERTLLSQLPGTWAAVAPLPDTPDGGYDHVAVATSTNGLIYALGGGANTNEMEEYNPTTNAWSVVASSPQHSGSAATALNGLIYAISGAPSGEVDTYNPATNVWTVVAPQPGIHRGGAAVAGIDGRIYVLGGIAWNGGTDVNGNPTGNPSNEVDTYNPTTNSWTVLANLATARNAPAAAAGLDGRIYAIGGYSALPLTATTEVDVYTPSTNSWAVLPSLPTARGSLAATTGPDGHIYAIGGRFGYGDNFYSSEVDAYSPTTNSWATLSSLPDTRESLGATTGTDGRIYAVGGNLNTSNGRTSEVDAYVPVPPYLYKVTPITSWPNPAGIAYGTVLGPTQLDATASVPGTFTYSPPAGTVLHAGANSNLSATFTPTDTADYTSVTATASINVTPAPLTVTAKNATKVYGQVNPVLTGTITALLNGDHDTATFSTVATTSSHVGTYAITPHLTDSNYSITNANGNLAVTPAPLTVTAKSTTKVYGQANPVLTGTITGLVNGDTDVATFTTNATASSPVGTYAITPNLTDSNYNIIFNDGTLTVTLSHPLGTGTWATVAPLPTRREGLASATGPDGTIYAIGGGGSSGFTSEVDAYNPATNTWTVVASLPTPRWGLTAATGPDGHIYAIGGRDSHSNSSSEVDAYNPTTNTWATVASLPTARGYTGSATGPDGRIYAIGGLGNNSGYMSEVDAYTPTTNTWTVIASLPTARVDLASATGLDGTIYAIGGDSSSGYTSEVDAYNPATPVISWDPYADITYGTALDNTQLDAIATDPTTGNAVPGQFTYFITATGQSANEVVLHAGTGQFLSAIFTPNDTTDYNSATATASINVAGDPGRHLAQPCEHRLWYDPG